MSAIGVPTANPDNEIPGLITTLLETERRLEILTAGEVDTVADRDGRTFVLRRAQDRLRFSETARQAAILNALPANIALLDTQGNIISVNAAWQQFATANHLCGPAHAIGVNYLAICDRSSADDAGEMSSAAAGIRSVLQGKASSFSLEYACHSPTVQRWFLMTVTPLSQTELNGAVVMHLNITDQKRSEQATVKAIQRMTEAQRIGQIGDWEWDIATQAITWSPQVFEITGRDPRLGPPRNYDENAGIYDGPSQALQWTTIRRAVETGEPQDYQLSLHKSDGAQVHIQALAAARKDAAGKVISLHGTIQDISQRKRAEAALRKSEMRYQALFEHILEGYAYCRTVFEDNELVDFEYVEVNGAFGRLTGLKDVIGKKISAVIPGVREASPDLFAMLGRVALSGKSEKRELYLASLGIWFDIAAYSTDRDHFVAAFENITDRKRAEQALQTSELLFRQMAENINDIFFLKDAETNRMLYMSPAFESITGLSIDSMYANADAWTDAIHPADRAMMDEKYHEGKRTGTFAYEYRLVRPDGAIRWIETRGFPVRDEAGKVVRIAGIAKDVTDRKRLETESLRFVEAMNATQDAIYLVDRATMQFTHVNDAACRMLALTRAELLERGPAGLLSVSPEELEQTYDEIIASGMPSTPIELLRTREDGTEVWVELRRHPRRFADDWLVITMVRDITERKRAEDALRQTQTQERNVSQQLEIERARLVAAQQVAKVGSWQTDPVTMMEVWSAETYRIYETDPATVQPSHQAFLASVHPDDRATVVETYGRSLEKRGADSVVEHRLLLPDGRIKFIEQHWRVLFDQTEKPVQVVGTCQDISERKLGEAALRDSELKFRQLAENINDAFWLRSPDLSEVHYVSPAFEKIWGRPVACLHDNPLLWPDLVFAEDRQRVMAGYASLSDGTENLDIEYRIVRPDGEIRWVRVRSTPVHDAAGQVIRLAGVATDITDRVLSQKSLQRKTAELRVLIDLVPAMIWFKDKANVILRVNQRAAEAAGRPVAEIEGQPWRDIYPQAGADYLADDLEVVQSGTPKLGRVESLTGPHGELSWIETDKVPFFDGAGKVAGIVVMAQDITARQLAEDQIRRLNANLEQLVKERTAELEAANKELEAFDYSVAHDLRAPIRHITGFAGILTDDYAENLDARGRDLLKRVQSAGHRMDQLVGDLLELSLVSRREISRTRVDLSALAQLVCAGLRQAEPGRNVECVVTPGLIALADLGQIRIVLENLLGNARKFTSKIPAAKVEFGCNVIEGMPVYFVRDNGAGFDAAYADRLFTPFQRLHTTSEFAGTGIGLATVMRIIARHGGKLWAEGAVDKGATFFFTLPS